MTRKKIFNRLEKASFYQIKTGKILFQFERFHLTINQPPVINKEININWMIKNINNTLPVMNHISQHFVVVLLSNKLTAQTGILNEWYSPLSISGLSCLHITHFIFCFFNFRLNLQQKKTKKKKRIKTPTALSDWHWQMAAFNPTLKSMVIENNWIVEWGRGARPAISYFNP